MNDHEYAKQLTGLLLLFFMVGVVILIGESAIIYWALSPLR
jgi:hypothetical protein